MKSILILKLLLVIYLSVSQNTIQCMQIKRVKKIMHKSHSVRAYVMKQEQKIKQALYARITAAFKHRDETLSIYKDVNEQMIKMWKVLQADGTDPKLVEAEELVLKKLYDQNMEKIKNDQAKVKALITESENFKRIFDEAKLIDETYEKALKQQKQAEDDAKVVDLSLSTEQKESKTEINLRLKYSLSDQILKAQQKLIRLFTNFLYPKKDSTMFKKNLVKAIENSMPDKFCYKKSSTLAKEQKLSCPSTHPDSGLGLCIQTCDQGQTQRAVQPQSKFSKFLGVCWEQCDLAKKPKCIKSGLIVYPDGYSWTRWNWQRSFIPDFKTVFSKDVTCQPNEKKWGFLCYQDLQECKNFGYQDCGSLSCSLNKIECSKVIRDMVVQTLLGLSKFALMFVAPGASSIIQTATQVLEWLNKLADLITGMLESQDLLVQVAQNQYLRKRLIKDAVSYMKSNKLDTIDGSNVDEIQLYERVTATLDSQVLKIQKKSAGKTLAQRIESAKSYFDVTKGAVDGVKALAGTTAVTSVAAGAAKTVAGQAVKTAAKEVGKVAAEVTKEIVNAGGDTLKAVLSGAGEVKDFVDDALDVFDISLVQDIISAGKSCTGGGTKVDCAKDLLGPIAAFDPTGIAGIARAYLYNTCKDIND